ncbi:MAG: response regulator transcription factor [Bacteroidetes bacterium]|nr:response regulator transcription factor [Bacteroidota bacterium]
MKYPILLSIYEDNPQLRSSINEVFLLEDDFYICGVFESATGIKQHILSDNPDMVLMDIDMPDTNGIDALKQALSINPELIVVMYTIFEDDEKVYSAICEGARGYILKKTLNDKLVASLKEIYEGGSYMTPVIARKALAMFQKKKKKNDSYCLSDRELEILHLLVDGYSYKMIAANCFISLDTVRSHIKNIYAKLQVNSNVEAVKRALEKGL